MNQKKQRELQENLLFLRERFDELNDDIQLPHSLNADMLRYRLEHIEPESRARSKHKKQPVWLKPAMGMAACLVLMLGVYQMTGGQLDAAGSLAAPPAPAAAAPQVVSSAPAMEAPTPMMAAVPESEQEPVAALDEEQDGMIPEAIADVQSEPEQMLSDAVPASSSEPVPVPESSSVPVPEPVLEKRTPDSGPQSQPREDGEVLAPVFHAPQEDTPEDENDGLVIRRKTDPSDKSTTKDSESPKASSENTAATNRNSDLAASSQAAPPAEVPSAESGLTDSVPASGTGGAAAPAQAPAPATADKTQEAPAAKDEATPAENAKAVSPRMSRSAPIPQLPEIKKAVQAGSYADVASAVLQAQGGVKAYQDGGPLMPKFYPGIPPPAVKVAVSNEKYSFTYDEEQARDEILVLDVKTKAPVHTIEIGEGKISQLYVQGDLLITLREGEGLIEQELPDDLVNEKAGDQLAQEIVKAAGRQEVSRADLSGQFAVEMVAYDVTDPVAPDPVAEFTQGGQYRLSKLEGDTLYLTSSVSLLAPNLGAQETQLAEIVPAVAGKDKARLLKSSEIVLAPDANHNYYTVISTVKVKSGKAKTTAVLGAGIEWFGSDGIYLTDADTTPEKYAGIMSDSYTSIIKLDRSLSLYASGRVDGRLMDMNESGGYLYMAMRANYPEGGKKINLYALDARMRQVGQLMDVAGGQELSEVLFEGDQIAFAPERGEEPVVRVDASNPMNLRRM